MLQWLNSAPERELTHRGCMNLLQRMSEQLIVVSHLYPIRVGTPILLRFTPVPEVRPQTPILYGSNSIDILISGGIVEAMRGKTFLMLDTMSIVEAEPFLRMVSNTLRFPSCRTMLVCTW